MTPQTRILKFRPDQIEAAEQHLSNLAEDDTAEQGLKSFDLVLSETISIAETATKLKAIYPASAPALPV